jgi:hypothetical protein
VVSFFRKLVLLKLEKGYNFGDAILDRAGISKLPTSDEKSTKEVPSISTSLFHEVKGQEKKLCVVAEKTILDGYRQYWNNENGEVKFCETSDSKGSIEETCSATFNNDLTLCHLNLDSVSDEKKISKAKKWTKKLWSHTSTNGLFVTIWTGSATQRAFVGIALNKAQIE